MCTVPPREKVVTFFKTLNTERVLNICVILRIYPNKSGRELVCLILPDHTDLFQKRALLVELCKIHSLERGAILSVELLYLLQLHLGWVEIFASTELACDRAATNTTG